MKEPMTWKTVLESKLNTMVDKRVDDKINSLLEEIFNYNPDLQPTPTMLKEETKEVLIRVEEPRHSH